MTSEYFQIFYFGSEWYSTDAMSRKIGSSLDASMVLSAPTGSKALELLQKYGKL